MANIYSMVDTWNDGATTFTAIKMDVTDTASASGSLLMDLQVGGSSKFSVDNSGNIDFGGTATISTPAGTILVIDAGSSTRFNLNGAAGPLFVQNNTVRIANFGLTFCTGTNYNTPEFSLLRDAANTLAQRNSTNAQTFNLYNTYTDASNYERGFMKWNSNVLEIGTEAAGTGTKRGIILNGSISIASNGSSITTSGSGARTFRATNTSGSDVQLAAGSTFGSLGTVDSTPFHIRTNNSDVLKFDTVGSMELAVALTVATLPAAPVVGMMARVTDATAPAVGSTVTGGGAAPALCWYNGTNWTVIGV